MSHKRTWVVAGATAVLLGSGAGLAVATADDGPVLQDQRPAPAQVDTPGDATGAPAAPADPSPESADSPADSPVDSADSANSADSPDTDSPDDSADSPGDDTP